MPLKALALLAILFAFLYALYMASQRFPNLKFGKLPGDINFQNGENTVKIPIVSGAIVGILCILGFFILRYVKP